MVICKKLLQEDISIKSKYYLFLKTIEYLKEIEDEPSYNKIIQELLPYIEEIVEIFEEKKVFFESTMKNYLKKYEEFWKEYLKYQVWLLGRIEDCKQVRMVLDYDKVHILGDISVEEIQIDGKIDRIYSIIDKKTQNIGGGRRLCNSM